MIKKDGSFNGRASTRNDDDALVVLERPQQAKGDTKAF